MDQAIARVHRHPGPASDVRVSIVRFERGLAFMRLVPEGARVSEVIEDVLASHRGSGGMVRLHGRIGAGSFCTAPPDPLGAYVIRYGVPVPVAPGSIILSADGSCGFDAEGGPCIHLHGVVATPDGQVVGGHLLPETCVAGPGGLLARFSFAAGATFLRSPDAESGLSLLRPHRSPGTTEACA